MLIATGMARVDLTWARMTFLKRFLGEAGVPCSCGGARVHMHSYKGLIRSMLALLPPIERSSDRLDRSYDSAEQEHAGAIGARWKENFIWAAKITSAGVFMQVAPTTFG